MHKTGLNYIINEYSATQTLNKAMTQKVIRTVAQYMVNKKNGEIPVPSVKRKVADSLKALFPLVFEPIMATLLPKNTSRGKLGTAFKNAKVAFESQLPVMDDDESSEYVNEGENSEAVDGENEEMDVDDGESEAGMDEMEGVDVEEDDNDQWTSELTFLKEVVVSSSTRREIKEKLTQTRLYRRREIMRGNTNLMFNLYRQDASFILFDFDLIWPQKANALSDKQHKLIQFVGSLERTNGDDKFVYVNDDVTLFQKLIVRLGKTPGGAINAANCLVKNIPESTTPTALLELCEKFRFPIIFKRDVQYLINIDGQPFNLPPAKFTNFFQALDLLLKVFFVFHIEYPPMLKKFYTFLASGIYEFQITSESYMLANMLTIWNNFHSENGSQSDSSSQNSV